MVTVKAKRQRPEGGTCCDLRAPRRMADRQALKAARLFRALSDPARLQILDILAQHSGEVCACDFEGVVGLPDANTGQRPKQPTISHHLKVLRDAGLIECEKRGLWVYCSARQERLQAVRALVESLTAAHEGDADDVGSGEGC